MSTAPLLGIPEETLISLVSKLAVMKPATVKPDNPTGLRKLEKLFYSNDYVAEDKIDGCHYLMIACRFFSTDHVEKTNNFPHLRDFFISLGMSNLILDGEINYPGKTSQYCTRVTGADASSAVSFQNKKGPIHYTIWDILRTPKGTWLINEPLFKRRRILEQLYATYIKNTPMAEYIRLTKWVTENKYEFKNHIIDSGGEGVVLKHLKSFYVMGKKPAWMWVKYKVQDTADLFISGYEPPNIEYNGSNFESWPYWRNINGIERPVTKFYYYDWIGALELSAFVHGMPTKICTCSGISEALRSEISNNKEAYLGKVVKITYMEKTEAGYPRHPRFEGFHESKTMDECAWTFDGKE